VSMYPNLAAGSRLTAANLGAIGPQIIVKTAHTDRSSTTTYANDPELTTSLSANAIYLVEFVLFYAGNAGLIKTTWTVPTGVSSANRSVMGPGSAATDGAANNISMRSGVHGYGTDIVYGNRGATLNQLVAVETSIVQTTSAGTCALRWAQNTSSASATRVAAGSYMRVTRIS
jgi:hypothetical protein